MKKRVTGVTFTCSSLLKLKNTSVKRLSFQFLVMLLVEMLVVDLNYQYNNINEMDKKKNMSS